jgi:tripartite-type tricarboxylate transporter receptor subunit TctC
MQQGICNSLRHGLNLFIVACALAIAAGTAPAYCQSYPVKPVRLIVPYPPGGGTDILARLLAQKLAVSLGQQFVVDNRPGAGANIGTDLVAKAAPDGYTLLMAAAPFAIGISLYPKLPYHPERDFVPVNSVAATQFMLVVHPSVAADSVQDLIALAKAQPGRLHFGSSGNGTVPHLAVELLKAMAAIDLVHVPYKGAAPAVADLIGGSIQVMTIDISLVLPYVRANRLKALAVTGAQRSKVVPALPTVAESGLPGYEIVSWYGIAAPAKTPAAIVTKLSQEISRALASPDTAEKLAAQGIEPFTGTPEQFGKFIHREIEKFARVVKISGAKVD